MFFCLQVDRPITGGAYKWQFTVNRSLGNVCAKYTKRKNCYTICQTVYWALWWQNSGNIKFLLTFLPRLHTQLKLSCSTFCLFGGKKIQNKGGWASLKLIKMENSGGNERMMCHHWYCFIETSGTVHVQLLSRVFDKFDWNVPFL